MLGPSKLKMIKNFDFSPLGLRFVSEGANRRLVWGGIVINQDPRLCRNSYLRSINILIDAGDEMTQQSSKAKGLWGPKHESFDFLLGQGVQKLNSDRLTSRISGQIRCLRLHKNLI